MIQKTLKLCRKHFSDTWYKENYYLHVDNLQFDDVDNSEGDDKADTDRSKGYCGKQKGFLLRHFCKDGANRDGEHGDVDYCCNNR